ncbi:biotin transporter BioY [Dysosmobacter sp.]|uniref:biotin transporter BioY n=1 Tax=Dysosmobacter sp. TaxID=2591382 RepID=UPI002A948740|nr:biotin transporter BioY [Dysosmobacter sp.]MDY5613308.1 biotin transporter BioY [Dysosmobacter sp.]
MTTAAVSSRLRTRDLTYIALFAVLMAVCAWITIPMTVPFTLQIFAVFAALATLGGRRGTYAVAVYLLLGAVGLPVGAGFQGGLGWLLGTTGGYIVGFLCIALIYWLLTAKLGESLPVKALACVLGLLVCYLFGTVWFIVVYGRTTGPVGIMTALGWCVFPYVVPDLLKLVLAVTLSQRVKGFLR